MTLKTTVGLTQNPKVVLAATTGQKGVVAGAEVSYDTNKGNVTTWNAGIGYNAADFQASVHLTEAGMSLDASTWPVHCIHCNQIINPKGDFRHVCYVKLIHMRCYLCCS